MGMRAAQVGGRGACFESRDAIQPLSGICYGELLRGGHCRSEKHFQPRSVQAYWIRSRGKDDSGAASLQQVILHSQDNCVSCALLLVI